MKATSESTYMERKKERISNISHLSFVDQKLRKRKMIASRHMHGESGALLATQFSTTSPPSLCFMHPLIAWWSCERLHGFRSPSPSLYFSFFSFFLFLFLFLFFTNIIIIKKRLNPSAPYGFKISICNAKAKETKLELCDESEPT